MRRWLLWVFVFGCGPTIEAITTPSGRPGYKILCAKTDDAEGCVREAKEACGSYVIETKDEHYNSFGPGHGGEMLLEWVIHCR